MAIPKGVSSPVIAGDGIYLTAAEDEKLLVLYYRRSNGELRWTRELTRARADARHPRNGPASPTPVTDGENVYVLFAEAALASFAPNGDERWRVELEPFHLMHGLAASLVLAHGRLFVLADQAENAFLAAYDTDSGERIWKTRRPDSPFGGYTTPVLRERSDGSTEVVVSAALELAGYSAETGVKLWSLGGMNPQPKSSPIVDGSSLYVSSASVDTTPIWRSVFDYYTRQDKNKDGKISSSELEGRQRELFVTVEANFGDGDGEADLSDWPKWVELNEGTNGLSAVVFDDAGVEPSVAWRVTRSLPEVTTPLLYNDLLYLVKNGGILTAVDSETGEVRKRGRIPKGVDSYYASPVAADGKLFLLSEGGRASVVAAGPAWTVLSTHELGEDCYATPAIAGGRVYVRTSEALYSFANQPVKESIVN